MSKPKSLNVRFIDAGVALDANCPTTLAAVLLICSADMVHALLRELRRGGIEDDLGPPPPIEQWVRLYDGGMEMLRGLGDADPNFLGGNGEELEEVFRGWAEFGHDLKHRSKE